MNFFLQVSPPNPCMHVSSTVSMPYTLSHPPWFICHKIHGNLSCTWICVYMDFMHIFYLSCQNFQKNNVIFFHNMYLLLLPSSIIIRSIEWIFILCCCRENCTLLNYSIAEGIVIFCCILNLCWQSSTFVKEHVFPHGKVALLPFQPLVRSISHYLVIGVMVFLQPFLQGTRQVLMWWCKVRTVGWMWQHCHCKVCDGLCCVQASVWPSVVLEGAAVWDIFLVVQIHEAKNSDLLLFQYSVRSSLLSHRQDVYRRIKPFFNPEDFNHDFSSWQYTFEILLSLGYSMVTFHQLPLGHAF